MNKSGIFIGSATATDVAEGGIIPIGTAQRGYGCGIKLNGDSIIVCGNNTSYKVSAVMTLSAASTDPITVALQQDGVPVPFASSTITVAGTSDQTVLTVQGVVRNQCKCSSALTFVLTGAEATIDNDNVIVETWGC